MVWLLKPLGAPQGYSIPRVQSRNQKSQNKTAAHLLIRVSVADRINPYGLEVGFPWRIWLITIFINVMNRWIPIFLRLWQLLPRLTCTFTQMTAIRTNGQMHNFEENFAAEGSIYLQPSHLICPLLIALFIWNVNVYLIVVTHPDIKRYAITLGWVSTKIHS